MSSDTSCEVSHINFIRFTKTLPLGRVYSFHNWLVDSDEPDVTLFLELERNIVLK